MTTLSTDTARTVAPDATLARGARAARPLLVAMTERTAPAVVTAARLLAARLDAAPRLFTVLPPLPLYLPEAGVLPPSAQVDAAQRHRLRDDVALAVRSASGDEPSWPIEVVTGEPAPTIVRVARERRVRLIVMGIGRHAPVDRLFGNETALQVIRLADRPVLAVAPTFVDLPGHAVVAVDFSPASVRAAEEALALLADGDTLSLVHVRPHDEALLPPSESWDWGHDQPVSDLFERLIAGLEPRPAVTITPVMLAGDPAGQVLAFAAREGATLIATGSSGIGFFERVMVGSVATRLLRRATVSVLAVPRPSAAEATLIERQLASRVRTHGAAPRLAPASMAKESS